MGLGPHKRYSVQHLLGDGTFGRVLACFDAKTGERVAVKVAKGIPRYAEHAEMEGETIRAMQRLLASTEHVRHLELCVALHGAFSHGNHYCLVFEPLDTSLRDFLKANDDMGLFVEDVRDMALQLLNCLAALHAVGITHTDLKCRNVMLRDGKSEVVPHPRFEGAPCRRPRRTDIVVIDFGSAVFVHERHPGRIGTRQFRSPESVLGLSWTEKADIWSVGCIIAMLYVGRRLFSVHEDVEHLAMMERVLGAELPRHMARAFCEARRAGVGDAGPEGVALDDGVRTAWPLCALDRDGVERVQALVPLLHRVPDRHSRFLGLILALLEINPQSRLGALEATGHIFFALDLSESCTAETSSDLWHLRRSC